MYHDHDTTRQSFEIETPKERKEFFDALERFLTRPFLSLYKETVGEVRGIGIGVPGIVDTKRGILLKAPNLPFLDGWNIKKFFQKFTSEV